MFIGIFLLHPILSLKPVVLIPGTYASVLQMTGSDMGLQWYCPKKMENKIIWLEEKYFIPPVVNCLLQWITVHYDAKTDSQVSLPGGNIDTYDFGGLNGVSYVDKFINNISFIPYYSKLIKLLKNKGYVEKETLYGAPVDWRFGLANNKKVFYPRLKKLCEDIKTKTGSKSVLIGHSFGGYCVQDFLANGVTKEWCDNYIDRGIMLAPSFSGSSETLGIAWDRDYSFHNINIDLKYLRAAIEGMGAVHIHFPNWEIYGDTTLIYGPNGEEFHARDIPQLLVDHGRITGDNVNLLNLNKPFFSKFPNITNAPSSIIYNSGRKTINGIKLTDWDSKNTYESLYGEGDGTLMSDGINKYCQKYKNTGLIDCHDLKVTSKSGSHFSMLLDAETLDLIYQKIGN